MKVSSVSSARPSQPKTAVYQHATAVALLMTLSHFFNDAYGAMLTPLMPALQQKFGVSIALLTLLSGLYAFTSSLIQPLLGGLAERMDRRYAAAFGPLMTGLGLSLMGLVPWFGLLMLLVAVAGLGSGFFHPAGAAYVAQNSPQHRRGFWASIFSAGGMAGMSLGPIFAGVGLENLHWLAVIGVVVSIVTFIVTPSGKTSHQRPPLSAYLTVFTGPIRLLWGMAVLRSLTSMSYNSMLPFMLIQRGFSQKEIGFSLALYALGSATGGIIGGRLSDRYGRTPILRAAILSCLPLFVGLILSRPDQFWFYPMTFLVAAMANASIPVGVVTAQEYQPKHVAIASSIMMGFSWGFAGILVSLVGVLAEYTSPTTAALSATLLLIPSVWLTRRLPEPESVKLS